MFVYIAFNKTTPFLLKVFPLRVFLRPVLGSRGRFSLRHTNGKTQLTVICL